MDIPPEINATSLGPPVSDHCHHCAKSFPADQLVLLGDCRTCETCKPTVLQRLREGVNVSSQDEQVRHEHLDHEEKVKAVGVLYLTVAALIAVCGAFAGIIALVHPRHEYHRFELLIAAALFGTFAAGLFYTGFAVYRFQQTGRILAAISSAFGLLIIPVGLAVCPRILYLLFCKKGGLVFSAEYQKVIAGTQHLRSLVPIVAWLFIALPLVQAAFVYALFLIASGRL